jgi:predicted Co/Zn/Cd cation transporter (cation efflux family)
MNGGREVPLGINATVGAVVVVVLCASLLTRGRRARTLIGLILHDCHGDAPV